MAQPPSNAQDSWALLAQIGTWVIVVIGWLIVNNQNNNRERRKEIRQAIDKIVKKIEEIEQDALQFHQSAFDDSSARALLLSLDKNSRSIAWLKIVESEIYKKSIISFRRSITLNNFDPTTHVALDGNNAQLARISAAAENLVDLLESAYAAQYLRKMPMLMRFKAWLGT